MNVFGPQGSRASELLPAISSDARYGDADTWIKNCTTNGANDGTVLDDAFFNIIIGNLKGVVDEAQFATLDRSDLLLLRKAILRMVQAGIYVATGKIITEGQIASAASNPILPVIES